MDHGESTNSEITQEATKQKSIATSSVEYLRSPRTETKFTPQGTREWFPHCPDDKKPYEGMKHENLDKEIEFYKEYAKECGFDPRSSSTYKNRERRICLKYYICCIEGFLDAKKQPVTNGTKRRKRSTVRIGYKAKIIWKRNPENGTYIVYRFYEGHTHSMFTPTSRQYLKSSRKMTMVHKNFVSKNALINIGPVKSFRLFKENIGSYDNVGTTMQDFRNFHRDLKQHIEGDDGKMLIENFISKRDVFEGFYFDYALDEGFHISHLFWADAICRKNYALFGEMISFDCTYNTNKYSMVLTPFTGVDHHRSCVTFGIGLLAKEDAQSFEWLFRTFLNAMENCEPKYMITDQDPVMKAAIEKVFVETKHRLCMWHITKKKPDKISPELKKR